MSVLGKIGSGLEKAGAGAIMLAASYPTYKAGTNLVNSYPEPLGKTTEAVKGYENRAQALGAGLSEYFEQCGEHDSFARSSLKTAAYAGLFGYGAYVLAGKPEMSFNDIDNVLEE